MFLDGKKCSCYSKQKHSFMASVQLYYRSHSNLSSACSITFWIIVDKKMIVEKLSYQTYLKWKFVIDILWILYFFSFVVIFGRRIPGWDACNICIKKPIICNHLYHFFWSFTLLRFWNQIFFWHHIEIQNSWDMKFYMRT